MADLVIGIDPGATGAMALYNTTEARVEAVVDTPNFEVILTTGKKTKRVDSVGMFNQLQRWQNFAINNGHSLYCHIEKVQAFGKQSAPAAFNFGYAACYAEAYCVALGIEYKLVSPQTWKKQMGLAVKDKDAARRFVLKVFPYLDSKLKFKYDVDKADAVLIAVYKPGE